MDRINETSDCFFIFDDIVIDCAGLRVQKDGQPRKITPRAFEVLVYLAEHHGRIIEKQELFDRIWKERFVTDNALARVIKEIRQVIGDDADSPRYIETIPKRGYRFIAEVKIPDEVKPETQHLESAKIAEVAIARALQETAGSQTDPAITAALDPVRTESPRRSGFGLSGSKLSAFAIIFGIVVVAALIWNNHLKTGLQETTKLPRIMQITTWSGLDFYPALSPDGNSIAYSSDHNGSFEIYVKPLTPGAREIQLTSDGEQNFQPSWSPDGKLIAYNSKNRGGIWIVPASGGTSTQLTEFGSSPAWSPDGSFVAFQSYPLIDLGATGVGAMPPSTLWIVPSHRGDPIQITQVGSPPGGHGAPSWSPDGKRIVFVAHDGTMAEIWKISANGSDLKRIIQDQHWVYDPIYSPDGEYLYYGGVSSPGNFVLFRARVSPTSGDARGEPIEVANTGPMRIKHLTISPDGKKLAYSGPVMKSSISSVPISPVSNGATGDPAPLTQDTSYRKGLPRISPDGRKIVYVEFRGGVSQDLWVMDAHGQNPAQLTTDPAIDWAPSWFPDNDRVAFQSHRQGNQMIWVASIKSGREKLLIDPGQDMGWPMLSPDGKKIAFNSRKNGTINLWTVSIEGGQPVQLTFDHETMGWPCWSPDGRLLAFQMRRGDDTNIMVMPGGGGSPTQLTSERGQSWPHSWSPDQDKIAFAGFRNGYWNIYWVSLNTRKQVQLTNYTKLNAYVRYPDWSALGNQIVYEYAETTGNIWLMELK